MLETTDGIGAYHEATKHHLHAFALGPGYLDWATQPDPFRRYDGARLIELTRPSPGGGPTYGEAASQGAVTARPVDITIVSRLFFDSLAISAWKQGGGARWALRVNPSSGNLHPTEGYLVAGAFGGVSDTPGVYHYAPKEHGLELRTTFDADVWRALAGGFPDGTLFVGLSSIHWREAWKYGERAYRYCQHDAGHAIAAIALSASALGLETTLLDDLGTREIAALLGLESSTGPESEHADCLLAVYPPAPVRIPRRVDAGAIERVAASAWTGRPNVLSPAHVAWPIIDAVADAAEKPSVPVDVEASPTRDASSVDPRPVDFETLVRQRRSAVSFDRTTTMPRSAFYRMLGSVAPLGHHAALAQFWWHPQVHLALFVHRVDDLTPGLYLLVRRASARERFQQMMPAEFEWETPEGCPPDLDLWRLETADARKVSAQVSCRQDIASDGCFSLGMVAELEYSIARFGPWFYPRLFWETGAIGQILYLEAEAAGLRGTGIGCFFDDAVHQLFGLTGHEFQSLYHFTIGMPVEDTRLTTLPAYPNVDD